MKVGLGSIGKNWVLGLNKPGTLPIYIDKFKNCGNFNIGRG
jgi:hypothetical protein